jgi:hypothetical protein
MIGIEVEVTYNFRVKASDILFSKSQCGNYVSMVIEILLYAVEMCAFVMYL